MSAPKRLLVVLVNTAARIGNWLLGDPEPELLARRDAITRHQQETTYAVEALAEERAEEEYLDFAEWTSQMGWWAKP